MAGLVPLIDFSSLGDLGKTFRDARRQAVRDEILSRASPDGSVQSLAALGTRLIQAGDTEGGVALSRLADAASRDTRDFAFRQQEARRAQDNADRLFRLREQLINGRLRGLGVMPSFDPSP